LLLKRIEIIPSPLKSDRVRLLGEVVYDDNTLPGEIYWFDVPQEYRNFLSENGNPWLVCLVPLAMTLGEPLKINLPVDRVLLKNVRQLQLIWKSWYPYLTKVAIEAPAADLHREGPGKTAAFFSGGIDSFFTILRHSKLDFLGRLPVDELITVGGFDIPVERQREFEVMRAYLEKSASRLGIQFVDISTNIKDTSWSKARWGKLAHGCGLATIAHLLDKRFSNMLVGSTGGYANLRPWGSHVLTDPLLSSGQMTFVHDGSEFSRIKKTQLVLHYPEAMEALHVCFRLASDKNCCRCMKCYRTMMTLDILNAKDKAPTFDWNLYKIGEIQNLLPRALVDYEYMCDIRLLAREHGRLEIAREITKSLNRSKFYNPIITRIWDWRTRPYFRRLGVFVDERLLSHLIT
jgi:hypothetical protein